MLQILIHYCPSYLLLFAVLHPLNWDAVQTPEILLCTLPAIPNMISLQFRYSITLVSLESWIRILGPLIETVRNTPHLSFYPDTFLLWLQCQYVLLQILSRIDSRRQFSLVHGLPFEYLHHWYLLHTLLFLHLDKG